MKRGVIIFLASLIFLFSVKLYEFAKITVLIEHYYEHKSINNEITFTKYFIEHYNSEPHTDNDDERDRQLPFKSHDKHNVLILGFAIPSFSGYELKSILPNFVILRPSHYTIGIYSNHLGKIWQPPKLFFIS